MTKKITSLTDEQTARFPEYVKKWTETGLCTEPANRSESERAIKRMYEISGLEAPRIVWCGSPLGNALTRHVLASVRDSVRDSVWGSVRASVWASVRDSVRDSVWDSVWDSVRASVRDSVWDSVWGSVRASVWGSVRDSVGDSVGDSVFGQHDAHWLAFFRFCRDECGLLDETTKLDGLWGLCQNAGWAIPCENVCFVSERHNVCRVVDNRIHCEDGPAIAYPDGFQVWGIGGVVVDEQIVMRPETQTLEQIADEGNAEAKRIRIERYGWNRYLAETDAQVLEHRRNDIEGTDESLMRANGMHVLVAACPSTGRVYGLEVPTEITSCENAQQWLRGGKAGFCIGAS